MKTKLLSLTLASVTAVSALTLTASADAIAEMNYSDVPADHHYYDSIKAAYERGYMNGVGGGKFEPDEPLSRAMLVTILYRADGEPAFMNDLVFTDVERGSWYEKAVVWAQGKGIVHGATKTTFEPDVNITREQLAAILYRYCEYKELDIASVTADTNTLSYDDIFTVSEYAVPAMHFCLASGAIEGSENGTGLVRPAEAATRAEAAKAVVTTIDLFGKASVPNPIVETDAAGLMDTLGLSLDVPEGATGAKYAILGGDTAQLSYTFDGAECTARIKPSAEPCDISGTYYTWTYSENFTQDRVSGTVNISDGENDDCVAVSFFDALPGLAYSFTAKGADLTKFDFEKALMGTFSLIDQSANGDETGNGNVGGVTLANPVVPADGNEIKKQFGSEMKVPSKATTALYSIISGTTAQLSFMLDGTECCTRMKKTSALEDISGMYLSTVQTSMDINESGFTGTVKFGTVSGKSCVVISVYNAANSTSYSFSALGDGAAKLDLEAVVGEIFF